MAGIFEVRYLSQNYVSCADEFTVIELASLRSCMECLVLNMSGSISHDLEACIQLPATIGLVGLNVYTKINLQYRHSP